jgi:ribosomal protein S6--L-glutamate ligase
MVLSFHPNIVADKNILCAGRLPNDEDRAAISRAQAVILPQGCSEALYRMSRDHCPNVFPNYDVRFDFPGKVGQARLFQKIGAPFPLTCPFDTVSAYYKDFGNKSGAGPLELPCIFKSDWGGEGEGVFYVKTAEDLEQLLSKAQGNEQSGRRGFLLQTYIPSRDRSLRVVVIGDKFFSYWRVQEDPSQFVTSLKAGAVIEPDADTALQEAGRTAVRQFCMTTKVNLAGFDLLFPEDTPEAGPLFLEINYFFGRQGLGGSFAYYDLLEEGVRSWLSGLGLSL